MMDIQRPERVEMILPANVRPDSDKFDKVIWGREHKDKNEK